ncbi:hypothetical protein RYX36_031771 [Vicia faba]
MVQFISSVGGRLVESRVERQARVNAACSSLIEIGFPSDLFTIKNIYTHGYTEEDLLEFIKPISCITDLDELRHLSNATNLLTTRNDFNQFIDHMEWLQKDKEGRKVMKGVRRRILKKKFEKKKELSKADVSFARELVDYTTSRIREHKQIKRKIHELKMRQMELERECVDLKTKLAPIYEYEELPIDELRIEAYQLYQEDCRSKGITSVPELYELGFEKVVKPFGGIVKERHLLKYLNDPIRRENVLKFFNKIKRLECPGGFIVFLGNALNENGNTVSKFASDVSEEVCGGDGDGDAVDDQNFVASESVEAWNETNKIPFLSLLV